MPELPEVEALADFLRRRAVSHEVKRVDVASITALKTFDPPPTALHGRRITAVDRHGKFLDLDADGTHLIFHLARAGWLRWNDKLAATPLRPGKHPLALRLALDDGSGFDLSEAGTKKRLAVYVVSDPAQVPGIAGLGPDPLAESFTEAAFAAVLSGRRTQIKGLLRDQKLIAGIGNAYSDEILHAARMSPFKLADSLTDTDVSVLYEAMVDTLRTAVAASSGSAAKDLKAHKHDSLRVHGRAGQPCPVCGDTIAEVSFADSALQYCPTCQTGGRKLADRRMSRLLK
ncbi:Fpg/Nei family DNA glycosylase [Stackebrandtia nassauensis]|uniref:DNA-formamidopyrimidine glycosylase n=1 Tax=Stackebrandtia nassauensis (strain DSM 44728 / CIP 108903 / NRRL B-16338 / NBRC 102104 / LLR-40K-21) TaxID=446470 RepID=D3PV54_STANL|nr:DNA-formamidopyrimidine glycosylase family protein [Stackebrandtia nassauensis]ADD41107.1 DNA-formamidopyrimidine glycosylase [Stackebrandtia nassauensis DSM 44728]